MLALLQQYRLLLLGLAVATLMTLSAAGAWQWQANAYGKQLAEQASTHAHTLGEIARTATRQLQAQQDKRQAIEQRLTAIDAQHYQEMTHAQDSVDQLAADLAAARRGLSVRINPATCLGAVPAAPGAASLDDAAGARAELYPATAASVVRVTGRADQCRARLTALQAWAREIRAGE